MNYTKLCVPINRFSTVSLSNPDLVDTHDEPTDSRTVSAQGPLAPPPNWRQARRNLHLTKQTVNGWVISAHVLTSVLDSVISRQPFCFASQQQLANDAGLKLTSVNRAIKVLRLLGLIDQRWMHTRVGYRKCTVIIWERVIEISEERHEIS